ncbi:hypothetical protein D3C84_843760 [compost metagenome]
MDKGLGKTLLFQPSNTLCQFMQMLFRCQHFLCSRAEHAVLGGQILSGCADGGAVTIGDQQAALQLVTDVASVGHLQAISLAVVVHVIEPGPIVHDQCVIIAVISTALVGQRQQWFDQINRQNPVITQESPKCLRLGKSLVASRQGFHPGGQSRQSITMSHD